MEWELAHKESWALKNWCFELRFWRRLLRVPWTARRSNQSILKEISPEYSLEELILKLKLQYFGLLMWRTGSLEKTLMLVKIEGRRMDDRGWDALMASPTWWTFSNASSGSWWWTGKPGVLQSTRWQKSQTWLRDWHAICAVLCSVTRSCPTLCDPMNCSTPGFSVCHCFPDVHWVSDAIQPSHPLSPPSPLALTCFEHQDLFHWVNSSHQVAKVLELQFQHQSFQWIFRTDFL